MVEVKINNVQLLKIIWNWNVNMTKYKQWHRQWFHSLFVMVTPLRKWRFPKDKELVVTKRQHNYSSHRFPTAKFRIWTGNLNQTPENSRYLMLSQKRQLSRKSHFCLTPPPEVVISFNDFHANEWQMRIVGSCLQCELNGVMGFIQSCRQGSGTGMLAY